MNVIMKLPEIDGLPIVNGSINVYASSNGHFIAYGDEIDSPEESLNSWTQFTHSLLWRAKEVEAGIGLYMVSVDRDDPHDAKVAIDLMATVEPAMTLAAYQASDDAAEWPCVSEEDGSICIPTASGYNDPRPIKTSLELTINA